MTETRVLLVEDEPGYARFLREVLLESDEGTRQITLAASLSEALSRLGEQSFDIVLLDLGLPDADGTEAVLRVAAQAPATPIVVLSARNDLDVAVESMRLGAQEYLVKGQAENVLLPRAMRYAIERKRLQDIAAAARVDAERASAVKDQFLAMLSHELRNPLASIVTALSLMRRRGDGALERERSIVERQVKYLQQLVDDLLDVSRIARDKMELRKELVDLADATADAVELAHPLIDEQRHSLSIDVPRGELFVDGERMRLAQVVTNLLTNAAKYTPRGGRIAVTARAEGDWVTVSVRDDGIGIAPDLLPRVFDMFEQGARSLDRAAGGLGLGLAIVKSIVSLHGGTVVAASEGVGSGSRFTVRLPARTPPQSGVAETAADAAPGRAGVRHRILIVDDNEDAAEMLDALLHDMGHATSVAHDGREALKAVEEFRPDVALLDIGLPLMNGYDVAREIRARKGGERVLLVAVSGYGQEADRARSLEAGFDHHFVKPVAIELLEKLFGLRA